MGLLRGLIERLPLRTKRKIEKRAARAAVWMSAARGALALRGKPKPRILIDNSVLRHGLTHSNAWISTGTAMWGDATPVETGYSARVPVNYAAHNRGIYEKEVPYFAPLAKLATDQRILLFTSEELVKERYRQSSYDPYRFGMNLWSKVPIERLADLPRSATISYCLGPYELREHWSKPGQISHLMASADQEFLKLAKRIPSEHILDFYHLWTAVNSDCSIFLTTDRTFRRFFENNVSKNLRERFATVKIMTPSELGAGLGIIPIPYHILTPLDCDWFYEMTTPQVIEKGRS